MQTQYFKNLSVNPLVKPLNELMELNAKTIQRLTSITPVEFLNVRKPEELLHKNMNAFINNTHTVLDYVQDVFHIFEHHLFDNTNRMVEQTKGVVSPVKQAVSSKTSNIIKKSKPVVRSEVSKVNETKKSMSAKPKSPALKKGPSSSNKSKANVHSDIKSGAVKHAVKTTSSSLKEIPKKIIKESSELKNASANSSKPMIQMGTDNQKDSMK